MKTLLEETGTAPERAVESLEPASTGLDYTTWHARLRGHNDGGSSSWPIPFRRTDERPPAGIRSVDQQAA